MPIIQRKRQTKSLFSAHIIYKVEEPVPVPLSPAACTAHRPTRTIAYIRIEICTYILYNETNTVSQAAS